MAKKLKEGTVLLEQQMKNILESVNSLQTCIVEAEASNMKSYVSNLTEAFGKKNKSTRVDIQKSFEMLSTDQKTKVGEITKNMKSSSQSIKSKEDLLSVFKNSSTEKSVLDTDNYTVSDLDAAYALYVEARDQVSGGKEAKWYHLLFAYLIAEVYLLSRMVPGPSRKHDVEKDIEDFVRRGTLVFTAKMILSFLKIFVVFAISTRMLVLSVLGGYTTLVVGGGFIGFSLATMSIALILFAVLRSIGLLFTIAARGPLGAATEMTFPEIHLSLREDSGGIMGMDFMPHVTTTGATATTPPAATSVGGPNGQNTPSNYTPTKVNATAPDSTTRGGPNGPSAVSTPARVQQKVKAAKTMQEFYKGAGFSWNPAQEYKDTVDNQSYEASKALKYKVEGVTAEEIVKDGDFIQQEINKQPGSLGERFFNWLKEMFSGVANAMPKVFGFLWRGIKMVFEFVGNTFGKAREKFSNMTPEQKNNTKSMFIFGGIAAGVIWLVSKLVKWFRGGLSRLMNSVELNASYNQLIQEWDEEIKNAKVKWKTSLQEAESAFDIPADAKARIVKLSNTAMDALTPVYTEVYNAWQQTKSPFWGAMTTLMDKIQKLFLAFVTGLSVPATAE